MTASSGRFVSTTIVGKVASPPIGVTSEEYPSASTSASRRSASASAMPGRSSSDWTTPIRSRRATISTSGGAVNAKLTGGNRISPSAAQGAGRSSSPSWRSTVETARSMAISAPGASGARSAERAAK